VTVWIIATGARYVCTGLPKKQGYCKPGNCLYTDDRTTQRADMTTMMTQHTVYSSAGCPAGQAERAMVKDI